MDVKFLIAGDKAVSVKFGDVISLEVNEKVRMLQAELEREPIDGVTEVVPTYAALMVHYRPEIVRYKPLVEALQDRISRMKKSETAGKIIKEIPVLYGGELGPDLEECARLEHTTPEEIIRIHSQHEYYVYMLGFAPGHPYMARFEEPFHFKRRPEPRVHISARSVVVQQNLSDLIPFDQPCGWNIIGATPCDICNFDREDPFLVQAGDWVKYVPINEAEYRAIRRQVEAGTYRVKTYEKVVD